MPRWLYSMLGVLAIPLIVMRLWWRGRREPGYRQHVGERFGRYAKPDGTAADFRGAIWIHAVSVGETRAVEPLLRALATRRPDARFLMTHMTPAGRATSERLYADLTTAGRLQVLYLPYDIGFIVRRFLARWQPRFGVLVETEIWPTLIAESARAGVAIALVNARLSERSAARGRRIGWLMRDAAAGLTAIVAQTPADARRIAAFGGPPPSVSGNLKFESLPEPGLLDLGRGWRAHIGVRPVIVLASTRDDDGTAEERLLLDGLESMLLKTSPLAAALVVIVPRHPQRFDAVAALVTVRGLTLARRSAALPDPTTQVWLGDSLGEMAAYFAMADIAMIGGSWVPLGGQNLIEACACGKPVIMGPSRFNFAAAAADAAQAGALEVADTPVAAWLCAERWLADRAMLATRTDAALTFASAHSGATERTLAALAPLLSR
ncbi:lipid IV(A) 3-deoxy-D-manno-octulosonic acid transferase [soil metagenome]